MKILYHSVSGIGNNLNASPAVAALHMVFPAPSNSIDVLTEFPELWIGLCNNTYKTGEQPSHTQYDLVVQSIFHADEELKGYKYDRIVRAPRDRVTQIHETESNLDAVRLLGYVGEMPPRNMALLTSNSGETFDYEDGQEPFKKIVGLIPGGRSDWQWGRKKWPHFAELAELLQRDGHKVIIIGGEHEDFDDYHAYNATIEGDAFAVIHNRIGKYTLFQTSHVLSQCDYVIANDCGPGHMASVLGIKTFFIWGPTSLVKNRPLEPNAEILRVSLDCAPCQYTSRWDTCSEYVCMNELTPHSIFNQIMYREV